MSSKKVTNEQKDFIATEMLRLVVANIKKKEKKSFDYAFSKIVKSNVYDMLYDFDTDMWKEGPTYI
ncbi:MAG: hypothetical protein MJ151_01425, partial [Lachnospiraceae bacterium]|nr:hypothetical protein [Lachnospiraceae bacterium]